MKHEINLTEFQKKVMAHDVSDIDLGLQSIIDRHIKQRAQQIADKRRSELHEDDETLLNSLFDNTDYKNFSERKIAEGN